MSAGRAGSGHRVGGGRLRVDAARAVGKLREYQLPDPHMWALEVVRAAVFAGATSVSLRGDAEELWVAWEGPALPKEDLARLLDELVSPAPLKDRRHLRLLATGLNTALGLDPRAVDVYTFDGEGGAFRARYTPGLLRIKEDGESGLRALRALPAAPPPESPAQGVAVHLLRPLLFGSLASLFRSAEPEELRLCRLACDDLPIPLRIGASELHVERSQTDLLRLGLGEGLDGFLAVLDPTAARERPLLHVDELGVRLAEYAMPFEAWEVRGRVPIRLRINAHKMPTNASRSAVRIEEPPLSNAIEKAQEALPALIARLARELGPEAEGNWPEARRERLRAAAIQLMASVAQGSSWHSIEEAAPPMLAPLLDAPLLRDALGRSRTLRALGQGREEIVHMATEPIPEELAPWLGAVLWAPPGDPATFLLGRARPTGTRERVRIAEGSLKARARWMKAARKREPLAPRASDLLRLELPPRPLPAKADKRGKTDGKRDGAEESLLFPASAVPREAFAILGLGGQVALAHPRQREGGMVHLHRDDRRLTSVRLTLPLPFEASLQSALLEPKDDYAGVREDFGYTATLVSLRGALVLLAESLARRLYAEAKGKRSGHGGERWEVEEGPAWPSGAVDEELRESLQPLLVGASAIAFELLLEQAGDASAAYDLFLASGSPLVRLPLWRTVAGDRLPLISLRDQVIGPAAVIAVSSKDVPDERGHRRVLRAGTRERAFLKRIFGERAPVVSYDRVLPRTGDPESYKRGVEMWLTPTFGATLRIEEPHRVVFVCWGKEEATLQVRHYRHTIESRTYAPALARCAIVVDDDQLVPEGHWEGVRYRPVWTFTAWERAMLCAFVDALAGEKPKGLRLGVDRPAANHAAMAVLMEALARLGDPGQALGVARLARLAEIPFIAMYGEGEPLASLDDLEARFPEGPIPFVTQAHHPFVRDYHPVLHRKNVAEVIRRLLGREMVSADEELARLERDARRVMRLEAHRLQIESPIDTGLRGAFVAPRASDGGAVAVALSGRTEDAHIRLLVEGRHLTSLILRGALPVDAGVDLPERYIDEALERPSERGERRIRRLLSTGVRGLLVRRAEESPRALMDNSACYALMTAWLQGLTLDSNAADLKARERLAELIPFPTVQGGLASLIEASRGPSIRCAVYDRPWLTPEEGERASIFDDPIVRIPEGTEVINAFRDLARALADRPVRNVTREVRALQAKRSIDRGLTRRPSLNAVRDPRFRYTIEELYEEEEERPIGIGPGEIALNPAGPSLLHLFAGGTKAQVLPIEVSPSVAVAIESPLVDLSGAHRGLNLLTKRTIEEGVEKVAKRAASLAVERSGAELPSWLRDSLRRALLGALPEADLGQKAGRAKGDPELVALLSPLPLFLTSVGEWLSMELVSLQLGLFERIWYTTKSQPLPPLERQRCAIRLEPDEVVLLRRLGPIQLADEELELDQIARENRDRPPIESLELPAELEEAYLSVAELYGDGERAARGFVAALAPEHAHLSGVECSREMRPLGRARAPAGWPTYARVDHLFTPDRRWSAPEADLLFESTLLRVAALAEEQLRKQFPRPDEALAFRWVRQAEGEEIPVRGGIWLAASLEPGEIEVRDPRARRHLQLRAGLLAETLPVHGSVMVAGASGPPALRWAERAALAGYRGMILDLLERAAVHHQDEVRAHLLFAIQTGVLAVEEVPEEAVPLGELGRGGWTLRRLVEHQRVGGSLLLIDPAERERAEALSWEGPILALTRGDHAFAARLRVFYGRRVLTLRAALREKMALDRDLGLEGRSSEPPRLSAPPAIGASGGSSGGAGEGASAEGGAEGSPSGTSRQGGQRSSEPIARAVQAVMSSLGIAGYDVYCDGDADAPVLRWKKHTLWLGSRRPEVRDAALALERRSATAALHVSAITAAVVSELRERKALSVEAELNILASLLNE